MLLTLIKAKGHSMQPIINDGSYFVASSIPLKFRSAKKDDIIIFKEDNRNIVKKIIKTEKNKIFVEGENKSDSKKFLPINKDEIIGKVLWIF